MTSQRPLALSLLLALFGCSQSAPKLNGDPQTLCTQLLSKELSCSGGNEDCVLSTDGGTSCPDMGQTATPDPADISVCVSQAAYWNVGYWNAFLACYLDGNTTTCDTDEKSCQSAAFTVVGRSKAANDFEAACSNSTCTSFSSDVCFASFEADDAANEQGIACFREACSNISACLIAAHLQ